MGGAWLLNTQVAFIGSMLVLFASFYGYQKAIKAKTPLVKLEAYDGELEDKELIKKTKKETRTLKSAFAPLRLVSYGFLVVGFLYLNRHGFLEIMPFLLGLSILPLGSLILGIMSKRFF